MPMPSEYRRATQDFDRYLAWVMADTLIESRNLIYTMTQGVFQTFRRRVTAQEALMFADVLPPVLRAIFVVDWDVDEPRLPFGSLEEMTDEVKGLRHDHNFSGDTVIADVVRGVWAVVDDAALERVLRKLPEEAQAFWRP